MSMPLRLWARAPEIAMCSERAITNTSIGGDRWPPRLLIRRRRARFDSTGANGRSRLGALRRAQAPAEDGTTPECDQPGQRRRDHSGGETARRVAPTHDGSRERRSAGDPDDDGRDHPGRGLGGASRPARARRSAGRGRRRRARTRSRSGPSAEARWPSSRSGRGGRSRARSRGRGAGSGAPPAFGAREIRTRGRRPCWRPPARRSGSPARPGDPSWVANAVARSPSRRSPSRSRAR